MVGSNRYSGLSMMNHWITALLVTAMLVLGFAAAGASERATVGYILGVHVSLGFFVFFFVLWRVGYRLYAGFPRTVGVAPWERWGAYLNHRAILTLLVIQVFTGPLYLFTEGEGVNVFGWFTVTIPLESLAAIHEPMEWIHIATGLYILPILLVLHVAGAIRHYLRRDSEETMADM